MTAPTGTTPPATPEPTRPAPDADVVEALRDAAAHLVGATSAYEKYAGNSERRSVRDPFFKTRLSDFQKAVTRAQAALHEARPAPAHHIENATDEASDTNRSATHELERWVDIAHQEAKKYLASDAALATTLAELERTNRIAQTTIRDLVAVLGIVRRNPIIGEYIDDAIARAALSDGSK